MADGEVEVEEKGKKERNWKDEESYSLFCMTVAGCRSWRLHEQGQNMVSQGQNLWVSPAFFESRFIIMGLSDPLFSKTVIPRLATEAAK